MTGVQTCALPIFLKYEGLSRDEAVEWVEDRLQALEYTEFSDRLTDNFAELQRGMAFAVTAVWKDNGYQKDPVTSEAKLKAAVAAWSRRDSSCTTRPPGTSTSRRWCRS